MAKRKIKAEDLVFDIKCGLSRKEIQRRHGISNEETDALFNKLVAGRWVQQDELPEKTVSLADARIIPSVKCPNCGMPQIRGDPVCRDCGCALNGLDHTATDESKQGTGSDQASTDATDEGPGKCPACGNLSEVEPKVCPGCGIIISKLHRKSVAVNDVTDTSRKSRLFWACLGLAVILVIGGVLLLHENKNEAILRASRDGNASKVYRLLRKGAGHRVTTGDGETPLILASSNGHVDVAKLLIKYAKRVGDSEYLELRDNHQVNALMYAAQNGHEDVVTLLLDNGTPIYATDGEGKTALFYAATTGQRGIVETLLDRGAAYGKKDNRRFSALDYAEASRRDDIVTILKQKQVAEERAMQAAWEALKRSGPVFGHRYYIVSPDGTEREVSASEYSDFEEAREQRRILGAERAEQRRRQAERRRLRALMREVERDRDMLQRCESECYSRYITQMSNPAYSDCLLSCRRMYMPYH